MTQGGLVQGGLGGSEDELLVDGQEEVFSRCEVEAGRSEHGVEAGSGKPLDQMVSSTTRRS